MAQARPRSPREVRRRRLRSRCEVRLYREDDGTEHVVEWVTQQDIDLARRLTAIAADHGLSADPAAVSVVELGLAVWAALLTGEPEDQGRGTPGEEIRDGGGRVPNLWFGDAERDDRRRQLFHVEVYVAPEVAEARIAAVVAAGGTVVESNDGLTVVADQDGNTGVLCVDVSAVRAD